jgi:Dolichyl-phosphate-mannose-protein mannosyltransferase
MGYYLLPPRRFFVQRASLFDVVLAIIGILAVYVLFITNNRERLLTVIAALTFGFNLIYYELSTIFMKDVPFTALAILSWIFYVRYIRRFSYLDLSIACALSVAAILCRQVGLFLPLAFVAALLYKAVAQGGGFSKPFFRLSFEPSFRRWFVSLLWYCFKSG